ncbi:MAG: hypothetical protein RMJ84_02320, partial [Sandaracinaceae bacterium]|nr:hypothetical protein [Sandaracinaceae bacterium]
TYCGMRDAVMRLDGGGGGMRDAVSMGDTGCVPMPENTVEACTDGVSNDCDRFIDCEDRDCCGVVSCGPTTYCGRWDGGVRDAMVAP